ncbi:unnamed protein product, partial [Owenia fusiformis]
MPAASPNTTSSQSSNSSGEQLSRTNLYIRGLTPNTTDKDLINLCQQYGKIVSTKAIIDQNTNKCKGYGFVDFESLHAADGAVKALQAQGIQAQMAKQQEQDPTNLYIANLPVHMSENDLESMFSPFGQVISTRILRDNNGISRGVGFCRMESKEKCEQIINHFNGKHIPGWKEQLLVKFADGGNKKKNQYQQRNVWTDRGDNIPLAYEQTQVAQNGYGSYSVAQSMMTQGMMAPRYSVSTTPVTNYQVPSGASWMQPTPYMIPQQTMSVMPSSVHPSQHQMDPNSVMPNLAQQMGQLQLQNAGASYVSGPHGTYTQMTYPQTQGTPVMPATVV